MQVTKAQVIPDSIGYPTLVMEIDGHEAFVSEPRKILLDAGIAVLLDTDGYWESTLAAEFHSPEGYGIERIAGGATDPKVLEIVRRYVAGETGDLLSSRATDDRRHGLTESVKNRTMNEAAEISVEVDREIFFRIGRALQRAIPKNLLGDVVLSVHVQTLTINSDWGGGEIACTGGSDTEARLTATAFCKLITSRFRETRPHGVMSIVFRPSLKEVAIDRIGVRAKFAKG
jgi:hypothetical protein